MKDEIVKYRESLNQFQAEHDCKYCQYHQRPRRCNGEFKCLLEKEENAIIKQRNRIKCNAHRACPKDDEGNCPYGNDSGTCFGFCLKEIIEWHRARRGKE